MNTLSIIEIKSEIGAGTRGASLGPDAIKVAALNKGDDLFFKNKPVHVLAENYLLHTPVTTPNGKRISGLVRIFERITKAVSTELEKGKFLLVMAGDHSTAGGTIAGIKKAHPDKRLGVVWVDAHADLHSPYTTPSGNLHGMPLATALGNDNLEDKINDIQEETRLGWEKLKNVGGISPKILPTDLVFIGVRDTEPAEDHVMVNNNIRNFKVNEVRQKGTAKVVQETLEYLKACDLIYVSFDVDSMDPEVSRGTGTPVAGGFTAEEAHEITAGLVSSSKCSVFEIVEVNPCLDDKINKMAETAFSIVKNIVAVADKKSI
ncbi:MAG TPA: arginase [Flavobacteriales bacterium]|nr:arginase [Flavobacteriales bacterium]HRJ40020.1 arginase [Flavobacteriales bacterium]